MQSILQDRDPEKDIRKGFSQGVVNFVFGSGSSPPFFLNPDRPSSPLQK